MSEKSNYLNKQQIESERAACSIGTVHFQEDELGGVVEVRFAYEADKIDNFRINSKGEILLEHYYLPKYAKAIKARIRLRLKERKHGKPKSKRNAPVVFRTKA